MTQTPVRKLAVLLHADIVGSTALVQENETLAHERMQDAFRAFSKTISNHDGIAPDFRRQFVEEGRVLPDYVQREFEDYLKCGRLEHGFLRVRCETCHEERLVAFSCKRRGFCPSCGARRMAESSALLVDEIFPHQSVRQWLLSFPFQSGCGPYVFSSPAVR